MIRFADGQHVEQPARAMGGSFRQLAGDVVTLVELQAELLQVDFRAWLQGLIVPVILLFVGAVMALAGLPLLLLSLAYCIARYTEVPMAASLLIAAATGFLAAGLCVFFALRGLRRESGVLTRFNAELKKNLSWLKQVLTHPSGTPAPNVQRTAPK